MDANLKNLIVRVRLSLSIRFLERMVKLLRTEEVFRQSKQWEGYEPAFDSWHRVFWGWVDREATKEFVRRLKGLDADWSRLPERALANLPCAAEERKAYLLERTRQEMLLQWAVFNVAMRGPEAESPETWKWFSDDQWLAGRIGIDSYFSTMARQKQRKPSRDSGNRRLKYQLLACWMPGCLWALTTDGVAAFLNERYPRLDNRLYHTTTISDARRVLKLYRTAKPKWWGISGTPATLVPLR